MSKNSKFHILRFLIVFFLLSFFFDVYIGIISPGGKLNIPFLKKYADFPAWLTYFICSGAKGLLQLCGYDVYQKALNNVTIAGGRGINIIWACLGFGVMSFWIAFVIAHKADWKYKLKWSIAGIGLITGINIVRMSLIAVGLRYNWKPFNALDIHSSFTIVSYAAIFGLMWFFVRNYKIKTAKSQQFSGLSKSYNATAATE